MRMLVRVYYLCTYVYRRILVYVQLRQYMEIYTEPNNTVVAALWSGKRPRDMPTQVEHMP